MGAIVIHNEGHVNLMIWVYSGYPDTCKDHKEGQRQQSVLMTGVDPTVDKGRYDVLYWVELFITCLHDVTPSILPDMELCVVTKPRVWDNTYRNGM